MHVRSVFFAFAALCLSSAARADGVTKPSEIRFGATLAEMQSVLAGKCTKPAEVLFYSQALAPDFLVDFQSKGGQP